MLEARRKRHVVPWVLLAAGLVAYVFAYLLLSAPGKDVSFAMCDGRTLWFFTVDAYPWDGTLEPLPNLFIDAETTERVLYIAFYPLVRADQVRGYFHGWVGVSG